MESELWGSTCCANCNLPFQKSQRICNITFENEITNLTDNIHVWDALAFIYGLHSEDFISSQSQYSKTNTISGQSYSLQEGGVPICGSCATLLSQNYKAHKLFENSTNPSSFVEKVTRFHSRKHQHQSIIGNRHDSDPVSSDYVPIPLLGNDNLQEDFHFEDEEDFEMNECDQEIEEKYEPIAECNQDVGGCFEHSPKLRRSTRMRELIVKLEKLSPEDLLFKYETEKAASRRSRKPTRSTTNFCRKIVRDSPGDPSEQKISRKKLTNRNSSLKLKTPQGKLKSGEAQRKKSCAIKKKKEIDSNKIEVNDCALISAHGNPKFTTNPHNYKPGSHKCKICGKGFSSPSGKISHERHHKFPRVLPLKICYLCGKMFKGSYKLRKHMERMHASEEEANNRRIPCQVCEKPIVPENMMIHLSRKHSSGPRATLKCAKCDKEYLSKTPYVEHMLTHSENFTPYVCNVCGKTFMNKNALLRHEKTHKEQPRTFACQICPKKFSTSSTLKKHQFSHSTERQFCCERCGTSYKFPKNLRDHLKIHEEVAEKGEYAVKCDECGRFFKHTQSLEKHKGRAHRQKKEYKCSFCGKRLNSSWNLKLHEDLHRKDPNYQPIREETKPRKPRRNPGKIKVNSTTLI